MSKKMELRHLRYFVVLAEELHFGRAADRLGIAQPSLSAQIQALEAGLSAKLLSRGPRSVALTTAGAVFLEEARLTLAQADRAVAVGRRAGRGELGIVRIGLALGSTLSGVPSIIMSQFRNDYPEVELPAFDPVAQAPNRGPQELRAGHWLPTASIHGPKGTGVHEALLREAYDRLVPRPPARLQEKYWGSRIGRRAVSGDASGKLERHLRIDDSSGEIWRLHSAHHTNRARPHRPAQPRRCRLRGSAAHRLRLPHQHAQRRLPPNSRVFDQHLGRSRIPPERELESRSGLSWRPAPPMRKPTARVDQAASPLSRNDSSREICDALQHAAPDCLARVRLVLGVAAASRDTRYRAACWDRTCTGRSHQLSLAPSPRAARYDGTHSRNRLCRCS